MRSAVLDVLFGKWATVRFRSGWVEGRGHGSLHLGDVDVGKALKPPQVNTGNFQEEGSEWADVWRRESAGYLRNSLGTMTSPARRCVNHPGRQLGRIFSPWGQPNLWTSFPNIIGSRVDGGEGWGELP